MSWDMAVLGGVCDLGINKMKAGNATAATLAPYKSGSGSTLLPAAPRPCTCHPDDNPPIPCAQKYAFNECRAAFPLMLEWPPGPKKYQRCGPVSVRPLVLPGNAFEEARDNYGKYAGLNFWDDLHHYLHFGFVVSRPNLFAMAKPIEYGGRRGWFIQIAVGNILELLTQLPFKLDFVAFCRNNDDDMRQVDWDFFIKNVVTMNMRKVA